MALGLSREKISEMLGKTDLSLDTVKAIADVIIANNQAIEDGVMNVVAGKIIRGQERMGKR